MEFVLGLVTGYLLTWPALIVLVVLAIFMEHTDSTGWAVFFGLVALVCSYFVFSIPLNILLMGVGGYTVIGLLWSFYRYKRFVSNGAQRAMTEREVSDKEYALNQLKASKNLGRITSWFVIWPISLIENLTSDIIDVIHTAITKWFHGVYESIFNSGTSEAYNTIAQQKAAEKARKEADEEAKKAKSQDGRGVI